MGVLLDSVILIDHFNDIVDATRYIARCADGAHLSPVTRAKVLVGFPAEEQESPRALLDHFPTLPIDADIADLAAALRRKYRWKLPDALQAAVARAHDLRLATRNTKDFSPDRHPFVVVPYAV